MFKKYQTKMLVLGVIAGGLLSSCANENEPAAGGSGNMIVKAPEMVAYSGNHYWSAPGGTRGVDVNGNLWYQNWDRPTNVTQEEIQKVLEAVAEPRVNAVNEITIEWENFWVQQVYKGQTSYRDHYDNNRGLGSDLMNELHVWNDNVEVWWPQHTFGGYEHVNNFNHGDNQTTYTDDVTHEQFIGTTLMTGIGSENATPENQFAYQNSADGGQLYFDYIVIEVDGEYYVCFDFFADNRDNPGATANKDHYVDRDWIFNDWIVKISPAYHKGETPSKPEPGPGTPSEPEDEDHCDNCVHPSHDGFACPECDAAFFGDVMHPCTQAGSGRPLPGDEPGEEPGVDNPGNPGKPGVQKGTDEVEVNLALDQKNDKLLESHLSIHVRKATDVEVFIPVPAEYYCDADDMAIVLEHQSAFVHGGPYYTQYEIGDNVVTLTVTFEEGGIRITTDGITQDVIDYCQATYGDGITFEVWNYFNDPETGLPYITMDALRQYLDAATVRFIDELPGTYINAFGKDNGKYSEANPEGKDFHVRPEEQGDSFDAPYEGAHLNGSDNNDIYRGKTLEE